MGKLLNYNGESKVIKRIADVLNVTDVQVNGDSIVDANGIADLSNVDNVKIIMATESEWGSTPQLIAEANTIYVYTDHETIDGNNVPAIKIGDGTSYLIDMGFVTDNASVLFNHVNNTNIHVTLQEKSFWNNKVACDESKIAQQGRMILTTEEVE